MHLPLVSQTVNLILRPATSMFQHILFLGESVGVLA
jgi:hypothetical protein